MPQEFNADDARNLYNIIWEWINDANEGHGSDVGDLMFSLQESGYGPPEHEWSSPCAEDA